MWEYRVSGGALILDGDSIRSEGLKESCPACGEDDCYEHSGHVDSSGVGESFEQMVERRVSNAMIDGVESLVLSLVSSKLIDLNDKRIVQAIEVSLDAIGNNS